MELGNSIKKLSNKETIIKSIVWNTIIDLFKSEKNINIKTYLISIQIMGNTIFIKTNKPIINTEALLINEKIKKTSLEKIRKLGLQFNEFDIKYK